LTSEQLSRVLTGNLYDLKEQAPAEQQKLITVARPIIISANERMVAALKKHPDDVFRLSSRQFEELIAELIHDMGYHVTLTKATRDGGKDILASIETEIGKFLCLVEAKHYRSDRKIGVSLVRELYGTLCDYQANSAMLVTSSSFSKDAHDLQEKHKYQLSLKGYTDVAKWIQKYGTYKNSDTN
jgi:HJR/Mrr/RecB family endonuclease